MRVTRCECGHDVSTHFEEQVVVRDPVDPSKDHTETRRGACLGVLCNDCRYYRPDEDSR